MIQITDKPISPQHVVNSLKISLSGSVVMHIGVVRPLSEGSRLVSIEYEMDSIEAEQELSQIVTEIRATCEIQDIALCRRIGKLDLGEAILVAAIAAPHRKEAFEACEQAVERMRNMVSVKKKEILK